ncbi:uncharacterized protein LOC101239631 isoform X2 [Hydra vulgaris]|uniref:Uncharacterized protein LOC101239631 isoform X2 n=1 Tax=Hydra vulgaris TaxID=6087 RepID=A0ABM4D824_HYDVU
MMLTRMKIIWFLLTFFYGVTFVSMKSDWSIATQGQCQFTVNNGFSILFTVYPALFIHKKKTTDLASCRMVCCNHDTCNGYVWDVLDLTENCKLLKCSSEGQDCKNALSISNTLGSGQVGFVTGYNADSPPVKTTTSTTSKIKLSSLENLSTHFEENKEQNKKIKKPAVAVVAEPKISNWLLQKFNALEGNVSDETIIEDKAQKKVEESDVLPNNRTNNRRIVVKQRAVSSHTDNVSLVMATIFGVGFLFAIMVMVCRRWVESLRDLHKRDYSRLSFLLDGND